MDFVDYQLEVVERKHSEWMEVAEHVDFVDCQLKPVERKYLEQVEVAEQKLHDQSELVEAELNDLLGLRDRLDLD